MNNLDQPPDQQAPPKNEPREMYSEISALVGTLAKTFGLKDSDAAAAVESGDMTLAFSRDANGNRFVAASYGGKTARLYQGAVKHADQEPDA